MRLAWFILPLILNGCMQFRMEEEAFQKVFSESRIRPVSEKILIGTNTIHFVYTDRNLPNLVVFIHGSPGSWSAFIDYFRNDTLMRHFDLLSIDRPGFGDSDYGRPEQSLAIQAELMKEVISRFDHQNKILVGHSLGGPVAARIAMDYPKLTRSMVLVAPSIDPNMEKYEWYRTWIKTRIIGALTPTDFWVSNEEIVPLRAELTEMLPLWDHVSIPTIVIQGTADVLVPWQNAEFAKRMLPDSLLEVRYLEGVNHFIPWSHPGEIIRAVFDLRQ